MASGSRSQSESLQEDLTCAICCDLFRDPVMLGCMHHFCKSCISTYWRGIRGPAVCPQCRQEFPKKQFQTNYLVAGLVEKVRASSSPASLKSLQHIKKQLDSQNSWKEEILAMIHNDEQQLIVMRNAGADLQHRVHSDFQALHSFLQAEEEAMMIQISRDQRELEQNLERHLEALHAAVRDLDQRAYELTSAANLGIPVELAGFNSRPEVQAIKGSDVDGFRSKYTSPLQYIMWRKLFQKIKPAPLRLTFDQETVHPSLRISKDKTQVVEAEDMLPYKPNPKRFIQCVNVLATQGFHAGRHYWEVGVGTKTKWDLGVALETVNRKARVKLCPANGYWTLRLRNGIEYSAGTQPWTPIPVTSRALKIGVLLNCEERRVSFYNADTMRLLYSFSDGPRGMVFPFFSTCIGEPGWQAQPICLLHYPSVGLKDASCQN